MNTQQHLQELNAAMKQWAESERILKILRTETGKPLRQPSNEEIIEWHKQNTQTFP
jgi:hypothetical protein